MFVVGDTGIEEALENTVPPQLAVLHSNWLLVPALPPVAVNVVEVPEVIVAVPLMPVGAVGVVTQLFTVNVVVTQSVIVPLLSPVPTRRTQ